MIYSDTKGNFRTEGHPGYCSFFCSFYHLPTQNMQTLDSAYTHYIHTYIHIYTISIYPAKQSATHQTPVYSSIINSIHLPIHIYIPSKHTYIHIYMHMHTSTYPPLIHPSIPSIYPAGQPHLSIHLPSILSIHSPIYPSTHSPIHLSICSSIHLFIHPPSHLPAHQSSHPTIRPVPIHLTIRPVHHLPNHLIHVTSQAFFFCLSSHSSIQPSPSCPLLGYSSLYTTIYHQPFQLRISHYSWEEVDILTHCTTDII